MNTALEQTRSASEMNKRSKLDLAKPLVDLEEKKREGWEIFWIILLIIVYFKKNLKTFLFVSKKKSSNLSSKKFIGCSYGDRDGEKKMLKEDSL